MSRYANKRMHVRTGSGRFRRAVGEDIGIMGTCPTCGHFLLRHYDGDPRDSCPDPRRFRNRCFSCEPKTEAEVQRETAIEAAREPRPTLLTMFQRIAEENEER